MNTQMNRQMNRQMNIRKMLITDYEGVYQLWTNTPGMGLNKFHNNRKVQQLLVKNHLIL